MHLSEDQILTLAPDESSKKAGKDLSGPGKWVTRGRNDTALWGECQGSGSKPYQTVMDTTAIAFKCSCPSRKFPCKHGLGLALLYARQQALFTETEAPAWAAEWLARRAGAAEKKAAPKESVPDEAGQLKRRQAREQKVLDGTADLLLWIKDLVRNGLVQVPEKGYAFWEAMARRMQDAQAPGLAGMIRDLGQTPYYKEGWQSLFLHKLLQLYLVASGYRKREVLPPVLYQEVRNRIGFPQDQESLKDEPGITDTWLVLARQTTQEEALTTERNWLLGTTSGHTALVLQFFVRGQGGNGLSLTAGMYIEAELVYYPAAVPLRAVIRKQAVTRATAPRAVLAHWGAVAEREASIAAQSPLTGLRPFVVENITPVPLEGAWWLADAEGHLVTLPEDYKSLWTLLALSGGRPLRMAVVGMENNYEPVGVWHQNNYQPL
ncbi:MAG TPA: SWIM zinc finger family protein [Chitinophagaceae bacterium]|nr:SWIM zinc finger family protein [Chitinophagaceae bacterium]